MTGREMISATLTLSEAKHRSWDVIVLGAGPSGAMTARECARAGYQVLLVDRAQFPRDKVCGCCINGAALQALDTVGLGELPTQLRATRLHSFELSCGKRRVSVPVELGVSLSRAAFDAKLIREAQHSGCEFLDQTDGKVLRLEPTPSVMLRRGTQTEEFQPTCLVIATGLGGRGAELLRTSSRQNRSASHIGLGTVVQSDAPSYATGTIYMGASKGGYVGIVRLEDGRLDLAAAMSKARIQRYAGLLPAIQSLMDECQLPPVSELVHASWRGTPPLTQRPSQLQIHSTYITGDAAGYVEPFTGEGIGWALASGIAVSPHVLHQLNPDEQKPAVSWEATYRRLVGKRQRRCRWVARGLRSPSLVRCSIQCLHWYPAAARRFQRHLNAPCFAADV